jgi:hypothetical protein
MKMSPPFFILDGTPPQQASLASGKAEIAGHEASWTPGEENRFDFVTRQKSPARVGICWHFAEWSPRVSVMLPGAVYEGNRFEASRQNYPPLPLPSAKGDPLQVSDVPRLALGDCESRFSQPASANSTPGIGLFFADLGQAVWILTPLLSEQGMVHFEVVESADRTRAEVRVWLSESDGEFVPESHFPVCLTPFSCSTMEDFLHHFGGLRNVLTDSPVRRDLLPFSAAWDILEDKQNSQNWVSDGGYYAVGTEPLRSKHISQNWQMGWTGGMLAAHALLLRGNEKSRQRALSNFDFVFPAGQAPSGFFYGMGDGSQWVGDKFDDPSAPWHLIRKSADGLFFMLSSLLTLRARGEERLIKPHWESGLEKCADAFVSLWNRHGDFGQFVNHDTGDLIVANSSSAALAPGALALAARYFPSKREAFLKVALAALRSMDGGDVKRGFTSGGPGDAMQCPDSESAAALLESCVTVFEETGNPYCLQMAKRVADILSTWVVSYDFPFPADSSFGRLGMLTHGTVLANVQNKHSAPGLCTLSGLGLFKLFLATGERGYLDLLTAIAHALPQFLSHEGRRIPFEIPYAAPVNPDQHFLEHGWMNERVNMMRWGPDEKIGEVFYCSCWPEISLMLTVAELPGVYARTDSEGIWSLDHLEVEWEDQNRSMLKIHNPTAFDAETTVLIEKSESSCSPLAIGFACALPRVVIPAGESVCFCNP